MGAFDDLVVLNHRTERYAPQKGLPPVLERKERKELQSKIEDDFRKGVQARDKMRSRATGKPLKRSSPDADVLADVHHVLKRSTNPDGEWEIPRGILLSRTEHVMAETRCPNAPDHFLLEITGPDDLGEPQTFTFRDIHGVVIKVKANR